MAFLDLPFQTLPAPFTREVLPRGVLCGGDLRHLAWNRRQAPGTRILYGADRSVPVRHRRGLRTDLRGRLTEKPRPDNRRRPLQARILLRRILLLRDR